MANWHISQIFLWTISWFVIGVSFGLFFILPIDYFIFVFIISILSVFTIFYKNKNFILAFLLIISFTLGFWRSSFFLKKIENLSLQNIEIQGEAKVVENSVRKFYDSSVIVYFKKENIKVLIKNSKYDELFYGDKLNLKCKLALPENFESFDYQKYLATKNVFYVSDDCEVEKLEKEKSFFSFLTNIRSKMEQNVNQLIPAPQSALANGLIFGGDNQLSEDLQTDFSRTGVTHIVAVSGYNITIIAMVIMSLAIWLGFWRKQAVWLAIFMNFIFVAVIGFPSSGVRAMIMGTMVLLAVFYGRSGDVKNAICFSGASMLFFNPLLLRYDVGFQLSFLATLGIVLIYPIFDRYFVSKFKAFGLTEIILLTFSAQFFVLPIILYNFHIFSNVSLLANLLILPIIPLTMLFVFLTMVCGFFFWPLATLFGWLAYFLLFYEVTVVKFLAKFGWSCFEVGEVSLWWYVLYYFVLIEGLRIWYTRSVNKI